MHHLLAFGTRDYLDGSRLAYVPSELETLVRIFTGFGYCEQLPDLRLNPERRTLLPALGKWLRDDARSEDDVVVIYYTGHGFKDGTVHYLAAADTEPGAIETAIESDVFVRILSATPRIGALLLIFDVCFAGRGALDAAEFASRTLRDYDSSSFKSMWVLAAAGPREEAAQGAFVDAFGAAIDDLSASTGQTQEFLDVEQVIHRVNAHLAHSSQEAKGLPAGLISGLPPFWPNPGYGPRSCWASISRPGVAGRRTLPPTGTPSPGEWRWLVRRGRISPGDRPQWVSHSSGLVRRTLVSSSAW